MSDGEVNLVEIMSIAFVLPQIYPPVGARPPPGFLIRDPTTTSAPTSVGSFSSTNSP